MTCSWITIVGWTIPIASGSFAIWRWILGQRITRAEFLERLIEKFKAIKYDEFLRRMESLSEEVPDSGTEIDTGIEAYDFLLFLTYVCYLYIKKVINEGEFLPFRCYVERTLCLATVREYLIEFHVRNHVDFATSPYRSLLEYGIEVSVEGIEDLRSKFQMRGKGVGTGNVAIRTIHVKDTRAYKTHLEVLNGVFHKGVLFHRSGGAPLDANTLVWFPHIRNDGDFAKGRIWNNTLSTDGMELRECCNDAARFGGDTAAPKVRRRYVFATFDNERERCYRFRGIFEFVKSEPANQNEIRWLYKRIADSFDAKEFA